jgi:hypothetical protein
MLYCTWKNHVFGLRHLTLIKTRKNHVFGLCPSPNVSKNTTFRKLDLFPFRRPNRVGAAIILPEDGNRCSFRNVVFLETLDDGQSTKT